MIYQPEFHKLSNNTYLTVSVPISKLLCMSQQSRNIQTLIEQVLKYL